MDAKLSYQQNPPAAQLSFLPDVVCAMFRIVTTWVVIAVVGFSSCGWLVMAAGLRMHARLNSHDEGKGLQRLVLRGDWLVTEESDGAAAAKVHWEHDREFQLRGCMYDVEHSYDSAGLRVVLVRADHYETEVVKAMETDDASERDAGTIQDCVNRMLQLQGPIETRRLLIQRQFTHLGWFHPVDRLMDHVLQPVDPPPPRLA
jgi:hypothetical protein